MIWQILGRVLLIEAALLVLPLITGIWYGENLLPFIITMAACGCGGRHTHKHQAEKRRYFRPGGLCRRGPFVDSHVHVRRAALCDLRRHPQLY
jgi:hypothetical protein